MALQKSRAGRKPATGPPRKSVTLRLPEPVYAWLREEVVRRKNADLRTGDRLQDAGDVVEEAIAALRGKKR